MNNTAMHYCVTYKENRTDFWHNNIFIYIIHDMYLYDTFVLTIIISLIFIFYIGFTVILCESFIQIDCTLQTAQ